jgi:hypothetical protein
MHLTPKNNNSYFLDLALSIINCLSLSNLPKNPVSIGEVDEKIRAGLNLGFEDFKKFAKEPNSSILLKSHDHTVAATAGLNTVGMLLDRLSILCIRYVKSHQGLIANSIKDQKIIDIVEALDVVRKGSSSINTKISNIQSDVIEVFSFVESCASLVKVNSLLWEAQEVLYLRGPDSLPENELRSYISFFAKENIRRNKYIQLVDNQFWEQIK